MFLLNPYRFAAAGGVGPYLDQLATQPRAAYGLRKLISTATQCIRVRNTATSVETDIGFSGDTMDTGALAATFTGSESVRLVKAYDQTGNGYHFQAASTSLQPALVASGVYQGTIKFQGSHRLDTASSLPFGTPHWGIYTRHSFLAGATKIFVEMSSDSSGANSQAAMCYSAAADRMYMYSQNGSGQSRQNWFDCIGLAQRSYIFDRSIVGSTELSARQNGVAQTANGAGSTEQTANFSSYPVYLGGRASGSLFANMDLDNLAMYDADTSAIRSSIEAIIAVAP